jgi:hypothetical protein
VGQVEGRVLFGRCAVASVIKIILSEPPSPSGEGRLVGLVQLVRNSPYGQP